VCLWSICSILGIYNLRFLIDGYFNSSKALVILLRQYSFIYSNGWSINWFLIKYLIPAYLMAEWLFTWFLSIFCTDFYSCVLIEILYVSDHVYLVIMISDIAGLKHSASFQYRYTEVVCIHETVCNLLYSFLEGSFVSNALLVFYWITQNPLRFTNIMLIACTQMCNHKLVLCHEYC
jgi:hypothetical protein